MFLCRSSPETVEDAKVWFLMCSQVSHKGDDCFVKMYDEKMDLSTLATFMRRLDSPPNVSFSLYLKNSYIEF